MTNLEMIAAARNCIYSMNHSADAMEEDIEMMQMLADRLESLVTPRELWEATK